MADISLNNSLITVQSSTVMHPTSLPMKSTLVKLSVENVSSSLLKRKSELEEIVVFTICAVAISVVNSLVISAFIFGKNIRTGSANALICSQAMIDLLIGVVFIPVYLLEVYYKTNILIPFLVYYVIFVSLFNLLALSVDRFLALSMPFFHRCVVDKRRTIRIILVIWSIPLLLTLTPLFWKHKPLNRQETPANCYLIISWIFMLVIVFGMAIIYFFVTVSARNVIRKKQLSINKSAHAKKIELAQKEVRVINLFGLLLFFFVVAYLPILYMNFCDMIHRPDLIPAFMETVSTYSLVINSLVNPILCIYLKHDYYKVIKSTLQLKVSKRQNHSSKESARLMLDKTNVI